jgi:phosphopantothenoylcysteine decarboxylase / phosphopantothenate---cysteine ligase
MSLKDKKILLGISSGIAAYKAAFLVRELIKASAIVKVVMTPGAKEFVTPLTLSTLSQNPVFSTFFEKESGEWTNHVELGMWADLMLIAPATANTIAKMANGQCDNLLLACYLSAKCPVFFAPAMDLDMFAHPATIANIQTLVQHGNYLIDAEEGFLASGLEGKGRMAEVDTIVKTIQQFFSDQETLKGKKVLISAGPTYEKIDSVRFIGNFSSGKMGFALAEEFAQRGAQVYLVAGPVVLKSKHPNIKQIDVVSAREMREACLQVFQDCNIVVMSAAVADFRPANTANIKIKKQDSSSAPIVELVQNPDILKEMGEIKTHQTLVGFALEDHNEEENALKKLKNKNLDFLVLNSLNDKGAGFGTDTNKVTIFKKDSTKTPLPLMDKNILAKEIITIVSEL